VFSPTAGDYWVIAQNWASGSGVTDAVSLLTAVIAGSPGESFNATGPGRVSAEQTFDVRLSWHDIDALDGEVLLGAVGIGAHSDAPANLGVIPVYFRRVGYAARETLPLIDGREHRFALPASNNHNRAFIDVPPGAGLLNVTANGRAAAQNNGLQLSLHRVPFEDAFSAAPFAAPAPVGAPLFSDVGSGGAGPAIVVSGGALQPGRWYPVVENTNASASSVALQAHVDFGDAPIPVSGALWVSEPRPGISQGIDYQPIGAARGLLWYTYADGRAPTWYLSAGLTLGGNIWQGDLLRFTNNGAQQQFVGVGQVAMTQLAQGDSIFSWTLFGKSGSERMDVISGLNNPCPMIDGATTSISGLWGKAVEGLGGASVLYRNSVHAEIHYMFDARGNPVWLQAAGASANDLILSQFEGYCPTCAASAISMQDVGVLTHDYDSSSSGTWNFNYQLAPPLAGSVLRQDTVTRLSDVRPCD
jgi:hypothetical protein